MKKNTEKSYATNVFFALLLIAITVVYIVVSALIGNDPKGGIQEEDIIKMTPSAYEVPSGPPNIKEPTFAPPVREE